MTRLRTRTCPQKLLGMPAHNRGGADRRRNAKWMRSYTHRRENPTSSGTKATFSMAALEFLKSLHIANKGYLDISIWHEMDGAMVGKSAKRVFNLSTSSGNKEPPIPSKWTRVSDRGISFDTDKQFESLTRKGRSRRPNLNGVLQRTLELVRRPFLHLKGSGGGRRMEAGGVGHVMLSHDRWMGGRLQRRR